MPESFQYDVFLSHSFKDKAIVRPIAERLRKDGLRVWFGEWEIQSGDNIPSRFEEGLERSRVLVLCVSANTFGYEWPRLESETFRFRDPLSKERRFVPVRLDDTPIIDSLMQFVCLIWKGADHGKQYEKLLSACWPPHEKRWDASTLSKQFLEKATHLDYEGPGLLVAFSFSGDGERLLSAANENIVRVWNTKTGRCTSKLEGHSAYVWSVAWAADYRRAISASRDRTVRLWDVKTKRCLKVFRGHDGEVESASWSANQRMILSVSK